MAYIVQKQEAMAQMMMPIQEERFELFAPETLKDVNGKTVTVPRSVGFHTVAQLEKHKANLLEQIADIDEKLATIKTLSV
jgi:hypothetical protein